MIVLACIFLVAGTLLLDEKQEKAQALSQNKNVIIRVAPNSVSDLSSLDINEVTINTGRHWINTINSIRILKIKTPQVELIAEPGIFDIQYGGGRLIVESFRRSMEVNFLGKSLVVPEGRMMTIEEAKLNSNADTISKLYYSKLIKEFPFFALEKVDEWVESNQKADKEFFAAYEAERLGEIRSRGFKAGADESSLFYKLNGIFEDARMFLTFDAQKREQQKVKKVFDYLDSAAYAIVTGRNDLVQSWLNEFIAEAQNVSPAELQKKLDDFAFVKPSDELFLVKNALQQVVFKDGLEAVHEKFNNALDIASVGADEETKTKVIVKMHDFGNSAKQLIGGVKNGAYGIFLESVRISDFLDRNIYLFNEEFLKLASMFEDAYLNDDQRQFLINEKIKRINIIKNVMESESIKYEDARAAILLLAKQIEVLKPIISDTAALAYLDQQISKLAPLIAFLKTSNTQNMRGSFVDNFADFNKRISEMGKIMQLLAASGGGGQISSVRREGLAAIVSNDLEGIKFSDIKMILPETEDDPRVIIESAKFESALVSGMYDTSKKIMTDIIFNGEKVQNAVRLENLQKIFGVKSGKIKLDAGVSEESFMEAPKSSSALEKVLKEKLIEALNKQDIAVEENNIDFQDLGTNVIHVAQAVIENKMFSFDVDADLNVISNLKVLSGDEEIPVNGKFQFKELGEKLGQVYNNIEFAKLKEEELKGLEE